MILILCNSYEDAEDAFNIFMDFLEDTNPWSILKVWEPCLCVETEDNLRYFFTDYRMKNELLPLNPDIQNVEEFFEGVNRVYAF